MDKRRVTVVLPMRGLWERPHQRAPLLAAGSAEGLNDSVSALPRLAGCEVSLTGQI